MLGVHRPDERDVVDLRCHVGQPGDGGLELARQVGQSRQPDIVLLDILQGRRGVDELVRMHPGHRGTQRGAGAVPAGLHRVEARRLETTPDLRHVLDVDPVELDVVPVGDVRTAASEVRGDAGDDAQLLGGELTAVDADAHHEELGVELLGRQRGRRAAVDALAALGVEPHPAEAPPQIGRFDRVEAFLGVRLDDALLHVEGAVVLLEHLVGVQRFTLTQRPLALGLGRPGAGSGRIRRRCHHHSSVRRP